MLGAIIGDIVGSIYEFDNIKSKDFPLFTEASRCTDDTVCTLAIADAVLHEKDPAETLVRWCREYPGMGYGNHFMRWIHMPWQEPYGSFGNGSAMRVSSVAWLSESLEQALELSDRVTEITHNHPEGMKGARATVHAVYRARQGVDVEATRREIASVYGYSMEMSVDEIRAVYKYSEACQDTVPQALLCAFQARDFEDALRNAISIGGDSDTIGAIAGSVAEALFGIPSGIREQAVMRLDSEMRGVVDEFYARLKT